MLSQAVASRALATWRIGPTPEVLDQLRRAEVNFVSWNRPLPAGVDEQLTDWAGRFPTTFDEIIPTASYNLSAATHGLAEPLRAWLMMDIAVLVARLAHLARVPCLRVSFGAVSADQCRKFHVDYLRYRLVTTYTGPGTEWVPDEAVRREALNHPVDCPCDANKEIVRNASAVRHALAGDVLVMKGARHERGRGAVHRSPPLEGTKRIRVVLIASTVDAS